MTEQKRDRWPSQLIFIFAAVGSAVGLGNFWRFPYLCGKYGGGAFLLPYLVVLFVMGIPLLIMEFAIGQHLQRGAMGAFQKIHKKFSGIGLGAVLCAMVICCYYAVIMAWSILYLLYALDMSWGSDTSYFFFHEVLNVSSALDEMGNFNLKILAALAISWIAVYFCVWKGVNSVSKVVTITMPLPVVVLVVLLVRSALLPGASEGLHYYLTPKFSALVDLEVWNAAMSQIFFTLTLGVGVMIAYGSYKKRGRDIARNSLIISLINSSVSLLAGFTVFTTLGFMSLVSETPVDELAKSGPSLAFIVFPKVLSLIPAANLFSVLFFVMMISLAIDSLFSLVEAVSVTIVDHFPTLTKETTSAYVCIACFLGGMIFTTSPGIYYIDIVDHFVTSYGLIIIGLLQALVVGWYYGANKLRKYINQVSVWKIGIWWEYAIKYAVPACLLSLLVSSVHRDVIHPYEGYPSSALFILGWGMVAAILLLSTALSHLSSHTGQRGKKSDYPD